MAWQAKQAALGGRKGHKTTTFWRILPCIKKSALHCAEQTHQNKTKNQLLFDRSEIVATWYF